MNAEIQSMDRAPLQNHARLRLWFLTGFILMFTGLLQLYRITVMDPSGQYATQCSLGQFYAICVPRLFTSRELGPASGMTSILWGTALLHLVISGLSGGVFSAVGWYLGGRRRRRS